MLKKLYWFILLALGFSTILPSLLSNFWFIDLFAHFRVQYILVLLFLFLISFLIKSKLFSKLLIVSLVIWNSIYILPLCFSSAIISENTNEDLSILSVNLLSSNTNSAEVLELIREKDPDILVLMELTPHWETELKSVFKSYPFYKVEPRQDNFGIALFSKIDMSSSIVYFENSSKPSIKAELSFGGKPLSILATHPVPPISSAYFDSRNSQLQDIARKRRGFSENFILIGDLNTSSFSTHFQELLSNADLVDSRNGFGIASTWPVGFYPLRTTLDHCLIGGGLQVLERYAGKNVSSDHLPIFIKVGI